MRRYKQKGKQRTQNAKYIELLYFFSKYSTFYKHF